MSLDEWLRTRLGDDRYGRLQAAWDAAPVSGVCGLAETVRGIAELACMEHAGIVLDDLDKPRRDRILVAVLDALPAGQDAAVEAAAEVLGEILEDDARSVDD